MYMENDPNNTNAFATKADLNAAFGKFEQKLDKKLDQKFDPVISKLDGIMKGVEALQQENTIGAEQLRRHTDQLQNHEARISKLETASV